MASKIKYIAYSIIFMYVLFILSGCNSTRVTSQDIISANQRATGRIESTVDTIDSILSDSRERVIAITESSKQITNGIDRLEYLFNEYERENNRIIDQLIRERDQLKAYLENNVDINSDMSSNDNSKDSSNDNQV